MCVHVVVQDLRVFFFFACVCVCVCGCMYVCVHTHAQVCVRVFCVRMVLRLCVLLDQGLRKVTNHSYSHSPGSGRSSRMVLWGTASGIIKGQSEPTTP